MTVVNALVGLLTGIISGFGIGGGSLLILYLTAVQGVDQHTAGGINLLYFIGCAPPALWSHIREKQVDRTAALWCAGAGLCTTIAASLLASHIPTDLLRRAFGVVLLYVGVRELFCKSEKR